MKIVVNKNTGIITKIVSRCNVPQSISDSEIEVEVTDNKIIDAFNKGYDILYDKGSGKFYYNSLATSEERIDELEKENNQLKDDLDNVIIELTMAMFMQGGM